MPGPWTTKGFSRVGSGDEQDSAAIGSREALLRHLERLRVGVSLHGLGREDFLGRLDQFGRRNLLDEGAIELIGAAFEYAKGRVVGDVQLFHASEERVGDDLVV